MKKNTKKLTFNKNTFRTLTAESLDRVAGGPDHGLNIQSKHNNGADNGI
jgi:hypothetical protein